MWVRSKPIKDCCFQRDYLLEDNKLLRDHLIRVMASLAAAISLLEKGGKRAAPSDKMFEQMLVDYRKALDNARGMLNDL